MSIDAIRWAWQQQGISATQKIILLSLADRANEEHECWPSIARLKADTCIGSRDTIIHALRDLEQMGLIRAQKAIGTVNRYLLVGVVDRHLFDGTSAQSGTAPVPKVVPVPKVGLPPVPKVGLVPEVVPVPKVGLPPVPKVGLPPVPKSGHEPISEPISEPYTPPTPPQAGGMPAREKNSRAAVADKPPDAKRAKPVATAAMPEGVDAGVWDDFLLMRRQKRAPLTPTALAGLEREADKAGLSLEAVLRECCQRGWQGFKAEWMQQNARASPDVPRRKTLSEERQEAYEILTGKKRHGHDNDICGQYQRIA
ncbi:MAG: helix-turn-helix domain-containing protein [Zoogloeaceae bacterium]|jgi:hypothetical protein|nr:helix-turn-helix domain-containing protein [Zoogloeaceae bacterium]